MAEYLSHDEDAFAELLAKRAENSITKRSRPLPAPYIKLYQNRKIEWS